MCSIFKYAFLALLLCATSTAHAEPFREGVVAYQQKDYQQALKSWLPLAKSGHVLAQTLVGSMYAYGEGVEKNNKEAFKWLSRAANTGSAQAQYNLGILYEKGLGTTANKQLARKWFQAAADQGREDAATRYALLEEETSNTETTKAIVDINKSDTVTTTLAETETIKQRIHVVLNDNSELFGPPDIPTTTSSLNQENHGLDWANRQSQDHYTIQLAASIEPRLIEAFKKHIQLKTQYADTVSIHDGKQWYAVIYGSYPTVREAKQAISQFPDSWKTWKPWIKKFSTVKQLKGK